MTLGRKALLATLPDDATLQRQLNAALAGNLLKAPHYALLSKPRRGGRVISRERLRWETSFLWLLQMIEEAFKVADVTDTGRDVENELAM